MKRIVGALILAIIVGAILIASDGKVYTVYQETVYFTLTDTCVDTVYGTVAEGTAGGYGLRVDGIDWTTYLPAYAGDIDSIWFDTAKTTVLSHPNGFAVASIVRTATVYRVVLTGGHLDSLAGTIHSATDSMILVFDSTGKTSRRRVGTCDSVINATTAAMVLTQAVADADSFYVGWTCKPEAWHATVRDDIDSFTTSDADTAYGGRSEDSLWLNAVLPVTITGWTFHGAKRGGNKTILWDTSDVIQIPPANSYFINFDCYRMTELDSTGARLILQNRMYVDERPGDAWRSICSSSVFTDTTAPLADTARIVWDNLGEAFRIIAWDVDSESRVANYAQTEWFGLTCWIVARY